MIKLLLKKEWSIFKHKKLNDNIVSFIINAIISLAIFVVIIYIFNALNARFVNYGVSDKLLAFTLGAIGFFESLVMIKKIDKNIYDIKDMELVFSSPISMKDLVISKYIALYIKELVSLAPLFIAVIICFGLKTAFTFSLILGLFLTIFFEPIWIIFFATLLSFPAHYLFEFLKNHSIVQVILSVVLVSIFSLAYYYVLKVFIDLISEGRLNYLFSDSNMEILSVINNVLIPSIFLKNILTGENLLVSSTVIILGSILLLTISVLALLFYYSWIKDHSLTLNLKRKEKRAKVYNFKIAQLKKEFIVMFRNSNNSFLYCTLLLSLSFICLAICLALKELVIKLLGSTFSFYPFALLIVSVFACVINGIGSNTIYSEKKNIALIKTSPIAYRTQINIKLLSLSIMSLISIALTALALYVGKVLNIIESLSLFITVLFLVLVTITSILYLDLKRPTKTLKADFVLLFGILVPGITSFLSLIFFYYVGKSIMLYIPLLLTAIIFAASFIVLELNISKLVNKLEVNL